MNLATETPRRKRKDIRAARLRRDAQCALCGDIIEAGRLVHRLDVRTPAHVSCDLRLRRAAK